MMFSDSPKRQFKKANRMAPRIKEGTAELPQKDKKLNLLNTESEKLYRNIIESIKTGIYISDVNGFLSYANHTFAKIFGYNTKSDVIGSNFFDLLYPNNKDRGRSLINEIASGAIDQKDYELKYTRQDGTDVVLLITRVRGLEPVNRIDPMSTMSR